MHFNAVTLFLVLVLTVLFGAPCSAETTEDKSDSVKALEILDQLVVDGCTDALVFELRGDALTDLGMEPEARRAYATASKLSEGLEGGKRISKKVPDGLVGKHATAKLPETSSQLKR